MPAIEPVRRQRVAEEIRPAAAGIGKIRPDRGVDHETLFAQQRSGCRSHAVPTGSIDNRPDAQIFLNDFAQSNELFTLERGGEIAGEAIEFADLLGKGRADPRVQVEPDLCLSGLGCRTQDRCCLGRSRDRMIDQP